MTKVCLDLFSGLGGFSEGFRESADWKVIRIDNDSKFKHIPDTHIADIMRITVSDLAKLGALNPDMLLMSWPCECFSLMSVYHYWVDGRPKVQKTRNAIALVQKSIALKDLIRPKYWVGENPNGMMVKVLGRPNHYTWWGAWYSDEDIMMKKLKELGIELPPMKPTSLWGILPEILWRPKPKKGEYQAAPRGAKTGIQNSKLRPEVRACIPIRFSRELRIGVESATTIQTTLA